LRDSLTFVHVAPPFSERKTPPSSASTMAHTRSGLAADAVTPILPTMPRGSPALRVMSVHVSPPSVDLKRPLDGPPLSKAQGRRTTCQSAA
jgi:hypothetical protein